MRRFFLLICCLISFSFEAFAQDKQRRGPPPVDDGGWSLYVGAGAFSAPTYTGDDKHNISAVPFLRLTKGDVFFASVQEGVGITAIDSGGFKAGPLAQLDFGRDGDGSSPFRVAGERTTDLEGFEKIDFTIALGAFAEFEFAKDMSIKAKVGKALGSHDGATGQLGLDYSPRIMGIGPPLFVNIGPSIKYGNSDYMQAFFGVTGNQSIATGLSAFQADGGIQSVGVGGSLLMPLSYTAGLTLFGSYDRLTGDAAKSPLVIERGSRDQLFGGAAIAYKF